MLSLSRQVEELMMIRCSLLPGEHLTFLDSHSAFRNPILDNDNGINAKEEMQVEKTETEASTWDSLLASDSISDNSTAFECMDMSPARFRIAVDGAEVSFEVDCEGYNGECSSVNECISINGDNLSRAMQEGWRERIRENLDSVDRASEYPLYELISAYLLPILHETVQNEDTIGPTSREEPQSSQQALLPENKIYHVLFTSHHLISSTKRRNLQNWSSALGISGFAKVGYPGVIYAQGWKNYVEEFATNVKAMQWLALKVRFLEPLEESENDTRIKLSGWKELGKVGEVFEEMRRLGRGKYIVEMGIGSGAKG